MVSPALGCIRRERALPRLDALVRQTVACQRRLFSTLFQLPQMAKEAARRRKYPSDIALAAVKPCTSRSSAHRRASVSAGPAWVHLTAAAPSCHQHSTVCLLLHTLSSLSLSSLAPSCSSSFSLHPPSPRLSTNLEHPAHDTLASRTMSGQDDHYDKRVAITVGVIVGLGGMLFGAR